MALTTSSKLFFIGGILFLLISIIFAVFASSLETQDQSTSPAESLETCNPIVYNGPDKINLVFLSTPEEAQEWSQYLLETSPFDEYPEAFNVYNIEEIPDCGDLYQGVALLCNSKETAQIAASCPNDYVFVIKDMKSTSVRSSSYQTTVSLNSQLSMNVIPHEFGHAFGGLIDEYVYEGARVSRNSKNCVKSCDDFKSEIDGCYEGCSRADYFRSVENGLMRTLRTRDYGIFNINILSQKLTSFESPGITGFALEDFPDNCEDQSFILIQGTYSSNEISIISKEILPGCPGTNGQGDYTYEAKDPNNQQVFFGTFNPNLIFIDGTTETQDLIGGTLEPDTSFILTLPTNQNQDSLEILDQDGNLVTETSLNDLGARPC